MDRWLKDHGMPEITRVYKTTKDGRRLTLEDDEAFGGYGFKPEIVRTEKTPSHNQKQSGLFRIPPMSVCFYRYTRARPQTKP